MEVCPLSPHCKRGSRLTWFAFLKQELHDKHDYPPYKRQKAAQADDGQIRETESTILQNVMCPKTLASHMALLTRATSGCYEG
jgi:hypothetical protein